MGKAGTPWPSAVAWAHYYGPGGSAYAERQTDCDGQTIRVKLNKKMKCTSLTAAGSEFSLLPAGATVVSAVAANCSTGFDFDELTLTLSNKLPNGTYQLVINNGTDGNSLKDACDRTIPVEQVSFLCGAQPIFADSLSTPGCAPDSIRIYFPWDCSRQHLARRKPISHHSYARQPTGNGHCGKRQLRERADRLCDRKIGFPDLSKRDIPTTLTAGTDGPRCSMNAMQLPQQSLNFFNS